MVYVVGGWLMGVRGFIAIKLGIMVVSTTPQLVEGGGGVSVPQNG